MIEVDRDGALLAGCVSLSSLANELEWKDGGVEDATRLYGKEP